MHYVRSKRTDLKFYKFATCTNPYQPYSSCGERNVTWDNETTKHRERSEGGGGGGGALTSR